ncbi:MAG: MBL fold metallo-hydrolase [Euryarchaeota archaeon]|nr:MBL fold metallo-hydrolase [Euryarchaeota archaeon]
MARYRFLGGAEEIGSLGLVLEDRRTRVLIDYGLSPDSPPGFPEQAPDVDAVLLTHAHLDHSGCLPEIAMRADTPIHTTETSRRVSGILHQDTLKIADLEGHAVPFNAAAVERLKGLYRDITPDDPFQVGDLDVTPVSAGHIPGAVQFLVEGDRRTLFTGDLFTQPTRLVQAARPEKAEVLFIETTYAGRTHPSRSDEETRLVAKVDEVVERGGLALIAAFATGRTQEVLLALTMESDHDIWVDGMGARVLQVFLDTPEAVADPRALERVRERVRIVRNHRQRRHAMATGGVIVATSGMLEGGPILHYLSQQRGRQKDALLLTGYQVHGTNGRRVLDDRFYTDRGVRHTVDLEVDRFDLSTHLGHDDIVDYVRRSGCDDVVLYHGYDREALVPELSPFARVHLPKRGETIEL